MLGAFETLLIEQRQTIDARARSDFASPDNHITASNAVEANESGELFNTLAI